MKIDRRRFLKTSAITVGALAVGGGACYVASRRLAPGLDDVVEAAGTVYTARFGDDLAATLLQDTWRAYEALEIPDIGGEANLNTQNLAYAAYTLAMYRALEPRGQTVEDVGRMIYELYEAMTDYPGWLLGLIGRLKYGQSYGEQWREQAARSQQRQYPGDWVFTYVEGDGVEFDYGLDFSECGICKLYHAYGADELTPYMCLSDEVVSRAFDRGLVRYKTIAEGDGTCDFRYKRGRETFVYPLRDGWPPRFAGQGTG